MGVLEKIEQAAAKASPPSPMDYIAEDGLLHCGVCHAAKECRVQFNGREVKRPCVCRCNDKAPDNSERIAALQKSGGISPAYTFDLSKSSETLEKCRRYAAGWEKAAKGNIGLLLWGGVGTGKTFAAHCICNELIQRDIPAFASSLSRVLNSGFDKSEVLRKVRDAPLVVFDDLGAERSSEYALETVFLLVDERYRAKRPLIVTTNLTLDELKNPMDIDRKRIYDRVLEMCVPFKFDGGSKRAEQAAEKLRIARELLGDG